MNNLLGNFNLLQISIDEANLVVRFNMVFVIAFLLLVAILIALSLKRNVHHMFSSKVELNIPLGSIGKIEIKQSFEVAEIAHKAWTELATRKAGLPIDLQHDLIVEIYDSWYRLFGETRELIKAIPPEFKNHESSKILIDLLVKTLNTGLRPHLTIWQAKFRRWYNLELEESDRLLSPQEIQQRYPHFKELSNDLNQISMNLVQYTKEIEKLF
ncbi:MAG: hypothetical protein AB7F28_06030 [Candidatus Margulisiibacteriota bacterium]